jgi:hypothetical protein
VVRIGDQEGCEPCFGLTVLNGQTPYYDQPGHVSVTIDGVATACWLHADSYDNPANAGSGDYPVGCHLTAGQSYEIAMPQVIGSPILLSGTVPGEG